MLPTGSAPGISAPVPSSLLHDLAAPHLPARNHADLSNEEGWEAALTWATRDVNPTVSLLQEESPGEFTVYDYALDVLSNQGEPIPVETWPTLVRHASAADLISLGYTAYAAYRQPNIAGKAWEQAANSDDPDVAPTAAVNLGLLLDEQGNIDGACVAFQKAIDSGHLQQAPKGAFNLGILLHEQGDVAGARAAYQKAIDSGHEEQSPKAAVNLGFLMKQQGDIDGACVAFQKAMDSGHSQQAPKGAFNLGILLHEQGDVAGARAAYQKVIDSDYSMYAKLHSI